MPRTSYYEGGIDGNVGWCDILFFLMLSGSSAFCFNIDVSRAD